MFPDFGKHTELVYTCYGLSLLALLFLIVRVLIMLKRSRK